MLWQTAAAACLLASGAQAGIGSLVAEGMMRNSPALDRRLQEIAKDTLRARGFVEMRQSTDTSNVALNTDGSLNVTAWDAQALASCTTALSSLNVASNPSGTGVCYNLPVLDNTTGTFEADLRLFQVSAPTGQFAGIPQQNIQVSLSYAGASVSPVSAQTAAEKVVARQAAAATNSGLKLLQTYMFVGQINPSQMSASMSVAQIEALVMPVVTLSAVNSTGQTVSTNVSSNEAAFVTGVFSNQIVLSTIDLAQLALNQQVAGLANGTVAFVLPGVQILIFPIGLVITGAWTVLGVCAYAYGTVMRIRYADLYKRQAQRAIKGSIPRI